MYLSSNPVFFVIKFDDSVKNLEIVMPDLIRHPEYMEITGFRRLSRTTIRGLPK